MKTDKAGDRVEPMLHQSWHMEMPDGAIKSGGSDYPKLEDKMKATSLLVVFKNGMRFRVQPPLTCQVIWFCRPRITIGTNDGRVLGHMRAYYIGWKDRYYGKKCVHMFELNEKGELFSVLLPDDGRPD